MGFEPRTSPKTPEPSIYVYIFILSCFSQRATVIKRSYFWFYSHLPALSCSTPLNGHVLCCFETLLEPKTFEKEPSAFILYNSELWSIDIFKQKTSHICNAYLVTYSYIAWYFFQICPNKNSFFIAPQLELGSGHHQLDLREMLSRHIGEGTQATAPFDGSTGCIRSVELTTRHEIWMHSIYIYANIMSINKYTYAIIWYIYIYAYMVIGYTINDNNNDVL